jgi:hypothetical protein
MATTLRQKHCGSSPPIWEMTSYHARGEQLVTGAFLDDPCANETRASFTLTLSTAERHRKERMMRCFATQDAVLAAFGVDAELFRHAPLYDFYSPPHRGALHYEQLGWPLSGWRWRELAKEAAGRLLGSS